MHVDDCRSGFLYNCKKGSAKITGENNGHDLRSYFRLFGVSTGGVSAPVLLVEFLVGMFRMDFLRYIQFYLFNLYFIISEGIEYSYMDQTKKDKPTQLNAVVNTSNVFTAKFDKPKNELKSKKQYVEVQGGEYYRPSKRRRLN